jgi:hypothetical protein
MTRDRDTTDDGTAHDDHRGADHDADAGTAPDDTGGPTDGDGPAVPTDTDPSAGTTPDPPVPSEAEADADPEGVLTPADLERVARQVRELDEDRVVVPTDGDDPGPESGAPSPDSASAERPDGASPESGAAYAVDVTVRTDRGVASESFGSNDLRVVFEAFLRWYAGRIDPDAPPERVVRVLLAASELDVEIR